MTLIPVGYCEVTYILKASGTVRQQTWTCGIDDTTFTGDTPYDIASAAYGAAIGATALYTAAAMNSDWSFLGVRATKMLESGPLSADYLAPLTGTVGKSSPPVNVSLLVNKTTAAGGRRNRGRFFAPPTMLDETTVDVAGTINPTGYSPMLTKFNALYTALIAVDLHPVLFHASGSFVPTPITGFSVQNRVATQRRRLRK